jgi:hypothetical protein
MQSAISHACFVTQKRPSAKTWSSAHSAVIIDLEMSAHAPGARSDFDPSRLIAWVPPTNSAGILPPFAFCGLESKVRDGDMQPLFQTIVTVSLPPPDVDSDGPLRRHLLDYQVM